MSEELVVYRYWKKITYPDYNPEVSSTIEEYKHVFREIMILWWNVEEFTKYVNWLLLMESDRVVGWEGRKWFSFQAMSDLYVLKEVHKEIFWITAIEMNNNPWLI